MKTLATAALLAALTLTAAVGQSRGDDPKPTKPETKAATKVTIDDVRRMLEGLGHEPEAQTNDDGTVSSYLIKFPSGDWTIVAYVEISPNGQYVWLSSTLVGKVDAATAPEALLAALEANRDIFPGYVSYSPKWKTIRVQYPVATAGMTPAMLKRGVDGYAEAVKRVLPAWEKAEAIGKDRKAEGQAQK